MTFTLLLAGAALICLVGLIFRGYVWFSQGINPSPPSAGPLTRFSSGLQAMLGVLFSAKCATLVRSFFSDLLFQQRVFHKSTLRWLAHSLIFFGFILLLLMHAGEAVISSRLFSDYQPTLNPYLLLRNLFGLMVLAGVALAVYRRLSLKSQRLISYPSDWAALILVGGIALTGMLYEGAQISSSTKFAEMVGEYGAFDDEETKALEAYWVAEQGLVSTNFKEKPATELIDQGREINGGSCIECHAANRSAVVGFAMAPLVAALGDQTALNLFRGLHIAFCLGLLAWLPFSKMFHIISAPLSLLINSIMGKEGDQPLSVLNRQMIGLSACTHCGSCSVECSSSMFFESFQNSFILPSEKVQYLKNLAAGKPIDAATHKRLQEGLYVCTSCDRCTTVCPSGINLRELFVSSRYALLEQGGPERSLLSHFSFPLALAQKFQGNHLKALQRVEEMFRKTFTHLADLAQVSLSSPSSLINTSYLSCFSCQRCTNICPVVRSYQQPAQTLGLLPHQIIYSLGLGNTELAMGAQMLWSCSTCYLCQEHCPNQVELTDIFYSLKNAALQKIDSGANS